MQQQNFNPQVRPQDAQQAGPQAGQQVMTQNRMPEPPQVITTKDHLYLTDALSWELDVIKKFNHFAQETQDMNAKNLITRATQIHQKHYSILLKHLNSANSSVKLKQ